MIPTNGYTVTNRTQNSRVDFNAKYIFHRMPDISSYTVGCGENMSIIPKLRIARDKNLRQQLVSETMR